MCPPSRHLASPQCACVGWRFRLPQVLPPLSAISFIVSSTCVPVFSQVLLPLSPFVSPHVCLSWMVCPPSRGLARPCLPLPPDVCLCLMVCPPSRGLVSLSLSSFLSQLVSQLVSLPVSPCGRRSHFAFSPRQYAVSSGFLVPSNVFDFVPQHMSLNPPTVWGLRWCNLKCASFCAAACACLFLAVSMLLVSVAFARHG